MLELLLAGADPNGYRDPSDLDNALEAAIEDGNDNIVAMLIHHGAKLNTIDGSDALRIAVVKGYSDVLRTL